MKMIDNRTIDIDAPVGWAIWREMAEVGNLKLEAVQSDG